MLIGVSRAGGIFAAKSKSFGKKTKKKQPQSTETCPDTAMITEIHDDDGDPGPSSDKSQAASRSLEGFAAASSSAG